MATEIVGNLFVGSADAVEMDEDKTHLGGYSGRKTRDARMGFDTAFSTIDPTTFRMSGARKARGGVGFSTEFNTNFNRSNVKGFDTAFSTIDPTTFRMSGGGKPKHHARPNGSVEPMTAAEISKINAHRAKKGRPPLSAQKIATINANRAKMKASRSGVSGKSTFIGKSTFVGKAAAPAARPSKGLPAPVKGEPVDVSVTVTAAANTMGVPPGIAMSCVAAARANDKASKKGIEDAAAVWKAAQKGDPVAKAQIEQVRRDAKAKNPVALQKAAYLAAAVGVIKGRQQWKKRRGAAAPAPVAAAPAAPVAPSCFANSLVCFGGTPGPFMKYFQGIRG